MDTPENLAHAALVEAILAQYVAGESPSQAALAHDLKPYLEPRRRGRNPRWESAKRDARAMYVANTPVDLIQPLDKILALYCRYLDEVSPGANLELAAETLGVKQGTVSYMLRVLGK